MRGVYVGVCVKTVCKEYEVGRVCGSVWMMQVCMEYECFGVCVCVCACVCLCVCAHARVCMCVCLFVPCVSVYMYTCTRQYIC